MILTTKTAKVGSALGPPLLTPLLPFDPWWIVFVLSGLILGWMARVGRLVNSNSSWLEIRKDILVSLLIGGGNGLLATILIVSFGLNYLQGVGVAFLCAFAGVRSLETAVRWLMNKFIEDYSSKDDQNRIDDGY